LIVTAKDQGLPGRDTAFGFGTVRPYEALTADVPSVSRNPLLPPGDAGPATQSAPAATPSDSQRGGPGGVLMWGVGLVAGLLVIGVVVLLLVLSRRRPAPAGPPPHFPPAVPPYPYGPPGAQGTPPPPAPQVPPPAGAPPHAQR
jgi:hypothetical protein